MVYYSNYSIVGHLDRLIENLILGEGYDSWNAALERSNEINCVTLWSSKTVFQAIAVFLHMYKISLLSDEF